MCLIGFGREDAGPKPTDGPIRKPILVLLADTPNVEGQDIMRTVTRRTFAGGIALLPSLHFSAANAQAGITPGEARAIAKEAYVYGFPVVDNYRMAVELTRSTNITVKCRRSASGAGGGEMISGAASRFAIASSSFFR